MARCGIEPGLDVLRYFQSKRKVGQVVRDVFGWSPESVRTVPGCACEEFWAVKVRGAGEQTIEFLVSNGQLIGFPHKKGGKMSGRL
jgi:hypothetical protein